MQNVDKQIVENCIESDVLEAEKYEWIQEFSMISLRFFPSQEFGRFLGRAG